MPGGQRIDDAPDHRAGHEWARRVVNEDAIRARGGAVRLKHAIQPARDRFLTRPPAADDVDLNPPRSALDRRRLLKSVRNALSRPRGPPEGIGGSPEGNGLENPFELLDSIGGGDDCDSIDDAGLGHRARRADEQRLAGKPLEGFCAARTESRSLAGGYDDGGDSH